ncbi:hypothetical protein Pint_03968 [Pistacia integerrima]|uniref:Uncharacterized protein n=1 Tax=Pistacia integerrima TaxID=434235 RepID=A0ACC0Z133_9ROSI|nr:hypothetical protein Pint_03968 [Pistacia integerrima]
MHEIDTGCFQMEAAGPLPPYIYIVPDSSPQKSWLIKVSEPIEDIPSPQSIPLLTRFRNLPDDELFPQVLNLPQLTRLRVRDLQSFDGRVFFHLAFLRYVNLDHDRQLPVEFKVFKLDHRDTCDLIIFVDEIKSLTDYARGVNDNGEVMEALEDGSVRVGVYDLEDGSSIPIMSLSRPVFKCYGHRRIGS